MLRFQKYRNNGAFKLSHINFTHITVANLVTFEQVLTDANISGCLLQKSNLVITTNNKVWSSANRINSTHIFASSPTDVGRDIPIIVAINGKPSKYNTMSLNHFRPNITSIPKIPLLSGGPSSRLRLTVDEIGDQTTLSQISISVASEGASGCGGTQCTSLSLVMQDAVRQDNINIVNISTNGVFRTASGTSTLEVGDQIKVSGCIHSSTNNGNFIISNIVPNYITLVNKAMDPIVTVSNKTGARYRDPLLN